MVEFVATAQCIVVEISLPIISADFAQSLQAPSLRQQQIVNRVLKRDETPNNRETIKIA